MHKALLTLDEAAERLSLGRTTVRKIVTSGEIRVVRIGRLVRVPATELQRWIDQRAQLAEDQPH